MRQAAGCEGQAVIEKARLQERSIKRPAVEAQARARGIQMPGHSSGHRPLIHRAGEDVLPSPTLRHRTTRSRRETPASQRPPLNPVVSRSKNTEGSRVGAPFARSGALTLGAPQRLCHRPDLDPSNKSVSGFGARHSDQRSGLHDRADTRWTSGLASD